MPLSFHLETSLSKCTDDSTQWNNKLNKLYSTTNGNTISDCDVYEFIEEPCPPDSLSELIKDLEKDEKNLEAVSKFVKNHKGKTVTWKNSDSYLSLCDLSGTVYMGQTFMQEAWEELYLPKTTKMQVFGTLENREVLKPCTQWIILVGEDGHIYAYSDEVLQFIAKNLQEFVNNGKKKVYKSYLYPECSDEDEEFLEQDEEVQKIEQSTRDFVNKSADEFEDFLLFLS
ncbi:uncharacterized protein RB166_011268 [Leptodactylus fuscus]|uniref:uncharacterized protein LOC142210306 n=1 Tax=Leptodactylus fuscus TaxID=238119 RepID=UPI003F4EAE56